MTRKVGECIVIGDDVVVTVVRLAGGMVRLGIEAPANYSVMREELLRSGDHAGNRLVERTEVDRTADVSQGGNKTGLEADSAEKAEFPRSSSPPADRSGSGRRDSDDPSADVAAD